LVVKAFSKDDRNVLSTIINMVLLKRKKKKGKGRNEKNAGPQSSFHNLLGRAL